MKTQLILASICAVLSVGALAAEQGASDKSAACSDWSFNNPSCAAYLNQPAQSPQATPASAKEPAACADWSFSDASCPAYLGKPGPRAAVEPRTQTALSCADGSEGDPGCAAYVRD
jgi:hypothetical protein